MPAKSRWLLKIPKILARLSQIEAPVVDVQCASPCSESGGGAP